MQFYKDLFDIKMEIAHDSSFDKDFFSSVSPRSQRYNFPVGDPSESSVIKFSQNLKFGQLCPENYYKI